MYSYSVFRKTNFFRIFFSLSVWVLLALKFIPSAYSQCINVYPHVEGFEAAPVWTPGVVPNANNAAFDWTWGTPNHTYVIKTAGTGTKSWCVGGLTGAFYKFWVQEYLESPCYDFTNLLYPHIKFQLFYDSEYKFDGGNLQSSIDAGATWQDIGAVDPDDCNTAYWYNYTAISYMNNPAGFIPSKTGWCGNVEKGGVGWDTTPKYTGTNCVGGNGLGHWVTAQHCLTGLAGQKSVLLRFTFAAGFSCNNFDGLAIDSVAVSNGMPNAATFTHVCTSGTTLSFTSTIAPCPGTNSLTWNFGDPASGVLNTTTVTTPGTLTHTYPAAGSYKVTLIASGGACNPPDTVIQIVNVMSASITASTNVLCPGGNTGTATATAVFGQAPVTYAWSAAGGNAALASGLTAGTYSVTVNDANNCTTVSTVVITQPPPLSVKDSSSPAACAVNNGVAWVTASGGGTPGYSYLWAPGGATGLTATALGKGITYTVTMTDKNNCTTTTSVLVGGPPGPTVAITPTNLKCFGDNSGSATAVGTGTTGTVTYTWNTGAGTANLTGLAAGSYSVTLNDAGGCPALNVVTITQPNPIEMVAGGQSTKCFGSADGQASVTLLNGVGTPPFTETWVNVATGAPAGAGLSVSNLIAGNYNVIITDANNCQKDTTVNVPQPPAVLGATSSLPSNCNQSDGSVNVVGSGGTDPLGTYSYLWSMAGGATSATVANIAAGIYTVTVTDNNSCTGTTTVQVLTIGGVAVTVQSSSPISCFAACTGTATAQAVGGTAPFVFSWSGTGGPYTGDTLKNLCQGNYTVTITDSKGCNATLVDTVNIPTFPRPTAAFTPNPTTASTYDPTFSFINQSAGASIYSWNFGDTAAADPDTSHLQSPKHTYPAVACAFCVKLIVSNPQGCLDSITHCISIGPEFEFYVPNAFSPNGKGHNEIFYGYGIGIIKYQMLVFDRWGNLIFTSHDLYTGWNGKANGGENIAQQDVYVYKIDLTDVFNKPHTYVGHVTLVK